MKIPTFKPSVFVWTALIVFFVSWQAFSSQEGVVQIYKSATEPFDSDVQIDSSRAITASVVLVRTKYQGGAFWTEARKDKIERFRCRQCHNDQRVSVKNAAALAHGDVVLNHGSREKPLSCYTCHNKDDRDYLSSEMEEKLDMDHSYELCGQCHFRQKKDWVGGAHGKRITFWAGKRIVKNCASCHDPHSPLFEKRWPKTYSPQDTR